MGAVQVNSVYRVEDDAIYGFFKEHRDLSNFGEFKIEWEGLVYSSTEAAFQASKVLGNERRVRFTEMAPSKAKQEGGRGKLKNIREDWDMIKDVIMYRINKIKYTQHEDAKRLLLSTGDKYLEETNWWGDTYWGVHAGRGHNRLGFILMLIRDELRSGLTVEGERDSLEKLTKSIPGLVGQEKDDEVDNISGGGKGDHSSRSSTP